MKKGLVSIIIPVYNTEPFLKKGIDSCLSQEYSDIEIIAINDGSTDKSGQILDSYALKDSRVHPIHTLNQGANSARLKGLEQAEGEWICFMDSDDYMPTNAISQLITIAIEKNLDMAIGYMSLVQNGNIVPYKNTLPFGCSASGMISAMFIGDLSPTMCARIIRRTLINQVEIPSTLIISEDTATNIALLSTTQKVEVLDINTYYYVQHKGSTMHRPNIQSVKSNISFCYWVLDYIKDKEYRTDPMFENTMSHNFLNKYFAFLRDGGELSYDPQFVKMINNTYLRNKWATSHLPLWRVLMLKLHRFNPFLGKLYRLIFSNIRKLLR